MSQLVSNFAILWRKCLPQLDFLNQRSVGSLVCAKSQTCISLGGNNSLCSLNALQAKLRRKTSFVLIVKTLGCGHGAERRSGGRVSCLPDHISCCSPVMWMHLLTTQSFSQVVPETLPNSALFSSYFHCQNPYLLNDSRMPASTLTYHFFAVADLSLEQNLEKSCDSVIWKCFIMLLP